MNPIDSAASAVLSSNEVLLAAPNNAKLTALYPTPGECTSVIAQSVNNSGQLFVNSNTLRFGSSSNFQISSANILDTPMLRLQFTIPGHAHTHYLAIVQDGWIFNMIRSIEVSYSNSNLSNLILTSTALRSWALAQCRDAETRAALLKNAGAAEVWQRDADPAVTKVFNACLPLSFLNWGSASLQNGFPFDARTINGIISIQINWQDNINHCVCSVQNQGVETDAVRGAEVIGVDAFDHAVISMRSYQLMDAAFSVGSALAINPQMRYTLPAKWMNSYTYRREPNAPEVGADGLIRYPINMELTSAPAGMLQGIMIHVRPTQTDVAGGPAIANRGPWLPGQRNTNYSGGMRLRTMRLAYSGQNIVNLQSEAEIDAYMQFIFGDNMKTKVNSVWGNRSQYDGSNPIPSSRILDPNGGALLVGANVARTLPYNHCGLAQIEDQIYIIPLMHDGKQVMRERHFENLPQYSGSALTLDLSIAHETNWYSQRGPNVKGTNADPGSISCVPTLGGNHADINVPQKYGPMIHVAGAENIAGNIPAAARWTEFEITVTYIIAALIQNSHGMVELQI